MAIFKGTQEITHIFKGNKRLCAVFKGSNIVYPMGTHAGWAIADYGPPHIYSYVNAAILSDNLSYPYHDITSDNFYAPKNTYNNHYYKTNFLGADFITDANGTPCIRVAANLNGTIEIKVAFEATATTGVFPIDILITVASTPNQSFTDLMSFTIPSTSWTPLSYTFTHNVANYPYTAYIYPICVNTHLTQLDNTIGFRSISIWANKI